MFLVATIRFREPTYSINESSGAVQPVLVLSNALSVNITVEVITTGKLLIICMIIQYFIR